MAVKNKTDKCFEIYANIVALMELRHSKGANLSEQARISIADNAYVASVIYTEKFYEKQAVIKKKLISKTDIFEDDKNYIALVDKARVIYLGKKRGIDTEFLNFRKKHADFKDVAKLLYNAVVNQNNHKEYLKTRTNEFVPPWPSFSRWINERRWEEYIGGTDRKVINVPKAKKETFL